VPVVTGAGHSRHPRFKAPFPVVETKLQPVVPPSGTIDRPRLTALLAAEPAPAVVSMIAPPGYGKTILLAQWAAHEKRPVAWVTLDDLDNDPARFVSHIAVALDRVGQIDATIASGIAGPNDRLIATAVPILLSALHRWERPAVMILDDAHRVVDRTCLDLLAALLDHLPVGFTVAIAGRTEPELPFARLRAQRILLEIGPDLLALDDRETAALCEAVGQHLAPDEARALAARTEGWAAVIYLATLARAHGSRLGDAVTGVSGADRHIAAYLRSEIEDGLADDDVAFLTRTAVLETIDPRAAVAVTGLPSAGERLRTLARRNLLVQELGSQGNGYRYHNLLRGFLLAELDRREPGERAALHRRAADWYAEAGDPGLAIEHALVGGDRDRAARLVTSVALPTYHTGGPSTVLRWLAAFEPAAFEGHPPLAVIAAWTYALSGRPDVADRMADIADRASFDGVPADGSASFESQRAVLRAAMARSGPRGALANADLALARESADSPWRPNILGSRGAAQLMLGDLDAADASYAESAALASPGVPASAMVALAKRASIRIRQGDWASARDFSARSCAVQAEAHYDGIVSSLIVHAVAARVAIHRGDQREAREELVRAQIVRPLANHALPWFSVDALLELARAYLAISDPAGAQVAVREAEQIVRRRPALGTLTGELVELRRRLDGAATTLAGSSSLTAAELRVLPLLPTYLSFQEIADRLLISRNTVKTHAMSIYGKLWASSRGEAVERAVELGLLERYPGL
jgi:LuxR family transcriptional regulator, maltose regulon positive regulatory protein